MVDEQTIIMFLRQLERALAAARDGDEQQRRHRLALTQSLGGWWFVPDSSVTG
jgi:hypothetical protein